MQEGHKLNLIRWKMCFWTILCSCIIRNPVNEILLTKNQRRIDCNTVSKFRNIGINTFLGLRFLNGMMQGIDTFSEFFEISKCDLSVLMRGQLSSMLLKIAVCIYWMGIIPWARNNRFCHMGRRFTTAVPLDLPSSI